MEDGSNILKEDITGIHLSPIVPFQLASEDMLPPTQK